MAKKLSFLIFLVSITISISCQNSYPKVVVLGNDTTVIFSKEQVKGLALTKLERNMFKEMSESCLSNALIMERKIEVQSLIIDNYKQQLNFADSIIIKQREINELIQFQVEQKDDEIQSLKRRSWIYIGVAIITTGIAIWK
jgi:hypothetical protein